MLSGGRVLIAILHFMYLLLIESSGISHRLYIGGVVSAMVLFVIAVVVTCLVTWRHGSGRALVIVRKGRTQGGAFSDSQVAACAQATLQKPHNRARSRSAQKNVERRSKKDTESIKRSAALGHRRSKSMSNLNSFDLSSNPFTNTGPLRRSKQDHSSASCTALDLPLPSKPNTMSVLFEDDPTLNRQSVRVKENVAYTTALQDIDSRPPLALPPPYTESDGQSHFYEQLDLVQISVQ